MGLAKKTIDWKNSIQGVFVDTMFILSIMPLLLLVWGLIKVADIIDYCKNN